MFSSYARLYDREQQEVHAGLVARAGRDVTTALGAPDLWCMEHGAHIIRALVEIRIYIQGMARQDPSIYRAFKEYGAGKKSRRWRPPCSAAGRVPAARRVRRSRPFAAVVGDQGRLPVGHVLEQRGNGHVGLVGALARSSPAAGQLPTSVSTGERSTQS